MKHVYSLLISLFVFADLFAQDVITKKDGTEVNAVVKEVGTNYVKYKLYEEPEGVTYTVNKSDIFMIRYASGKKEVFAQKGYNMYDDGREPVEGIEPNMKYHTLKKNYNYKEYVPTYYDRHSPVWSGVASFFIPGLGECINNEWVRGLVKFCSIATLSATLMVTSNVWLNCYSDDSSYGQTRIAVAVIPFAAALGIDIWSIVDAVRIAKIKNMYEQDLKKLYSMSFNLYPSINYIHTANGLQPTAGFTFALNF